MSDDSSDASSDDDDLLKMEEIPGTPADGNAFAGLSAKFRQIIYQGGPGFMKFLISLTLIFTTKAGLYQVLQYYRTGFQCARTLCFQNNLSLSHKECKELCQVCQIPVILPEVRSHPQATFPLAQRVAATEIRRFLQAGSIIAYTNGLAENAGPLNKDSAEGYLARDILTTGLSLVNLLEEFHPYPLIFSSAVERLGRRLVSYEAALTRDREDRSAFYEKNLSYVGLRGVASGKSLKKLS